VVWNGEIMPLNEVEARLHEEGAKPRDEQAEIHLRPDRRAKYDMVAKVLAASQRQHMQKIGFANTAEFAEE